MRSRLGTFRLSRARPANRSRVWLLAAAWLAFLPASGSTSGPAQAAPDTAAAVEIRTDEAAHVFADSIRFSLDARAKDADESIVDVVLRFEVDGGEVRDRRLPEFTPGRAIRAEHVEELDRGSIWPAAKIVWWWTLELESGAQMSTPRGSLTYIDERFDWQTLSGADGSVRVWHYGGRSRAKRAEEVARAAGEAIERLGPLVGSRPDRTVEIVAYRNQSELRPALAARGEVYEARLRTLGARVGPATIVLDTEEGGRDLAMIVAHELSHVVLGLHLEHSWISAPMWLDEGMAMYAEGRFEGAEKRALDAALEADDLMSVRSLTSFPGEALAVTQAYGQSRDFVAFLLEEHPADRFQLFLDLLGLGTLTADEALDQAYGFDQFEMYQAYRAARGLPPLSVSETLPGAGADDGAPDVGRAGARNGSDEAPTIGGETDPVPDAASEPADALDTAAVPIVLAVVALLLTGGLAVAVRRVGRSASGTVD